MEIAPSLCSLFNKSPLLGRLPSEWKRSFVVPVHKKLRRDKVENYRPFSLLCIVSKVFVRRASSSTPVNHLTKYLSTCQHGFLQGRSTVTQLLGFLHKIGSALDKGQQSDILCLDFAKAFDSVSHSRLVYWNYTITASEDVCLDGLKTTAFPTVFILLCCRVQLPLPYQYYLAYHRVVYYRSTSLPNIHKRSSFGCCNICLRIIQHQPVCGRL